jgi:hypothetical protein
MKRCLSTGNVNDSGDAFITITNKKSKKQKSLRNSLSASQPSTSVVNMEKVIDAVAHINDPDITQDKACLSDKTALHEIAELRSLVKLLSDQVSFLLSYVGVIETDPSSFFEQYPIPVPVPVPIHASKPSYSHAVQQPIPSRSLKEAIVTAVYVDQTKKTGQAANVVITGLPVNQLSSDKTSVNKLLVTELNLHVNVVKCRRLGKTVTGKIQPLLVSLNSVDEADQVMANAKRLRGSSDCTVRDGIYINRHLTAAESRAAYELRCQRRQSAQQRSTRQVSLSGELSTTEIGHRIQQHKERSVQQQQHQLQQLPIHSNGKEPLVISTSQLNATVPSFQPIASFLPTNNGTQTVGTSN